MVFNNGFIIQTIRVNVDETGGNYTYPIAFSQIVWPVLAGHYQGDHGISVSYTLTNVSVGYSNHKGSYNDASIVCGF